MKTKIWLRSKISIDLMSWTHPVPEKRHGGGWQWSTDNHCAEHNALLKTRQQDKKGLQNYDAPLFYV